MSSRTLALFDSRTYQVSEKRAAQLVPLLVPPNRGLFADEELPVMVARTDHLKAALRLELGLKGPPPS